ncbi:MAG: TonB-dependent receptor, partial [Pseudomonadota bacterium]
MPWVVHAQDVDPAVDELTGERVMESVTVTARRVEESLQDVPITVTSIGGDTLDTFNITSVDKLESRVPSLRFQQGGPNGGATLSLRGISTSNLSPSFESSVALNFDDIFVGQLRILQGGFFDIDQVEVLKGPQSVFFGKSASAGVLTLKSAGPTDEFEAGLRAGYEFEEEGLFAEGFISGPITNTLGGRLAVRYSNTDALVENSFPGVANPERGSEDIYVRSTLEWEPTEKFIASGKFTYIRNERDGANLFADIDCGPNGVADDVALGFITLPAGYDCDVGNGVFAFADPAEALTLDVGLGFPSTNVPFHETDIFLASLKGDYSINDWLNFTSITGYYGLEVLELEAFSFGGILGVGENGLPIQGGTGLGFPNFETDQWTQEFRLSSDTGGFIDFSLGAFYEFRINVADTPLFAANIGLLAPDPVTGFTSDVIKLQDTDSETYSVYASAVVRPTDRITLTGGVRYTN